jgi:hypothetical protein
MIKEKLNFTPDKYSEEFLKDDNYIFCDISKNEYLFHMQYLLNENSACIAYYKNEIKQPIYVSSLNECIEFINVFFRKEYDKILKITTDDIG